MLGLPPGYASAFPGELRLLSGSADGALLAQQTAANLHARPGDIVRIGRPGGRAARVRVAGVVDLPAADSLFQQVGAPVGAQPQAPPDNVVLLPQRGASTAPMRGVPVTTQVHAALSHRLPGSPSSAFTRVSGAARNLETPARRRRARGRQPRRGARRGPPGRPVRPAPVPVPRRPRRRARRACSPPRSPPPAATGAAATSRCCARAARPPGRLVRVALAETAVAGGIGVAAGLAGALAIGAAAFGTASFGAGRVAAVLWAGGSALAGLAIAAAAIALPAWRDARALTVAGQRRRVGRPDARAVVGALRGGLHRARRRGVRLLAGVAGTATSSCSRPRACRRCRSTGTRCWRPCSAGSARGLLIVPAREPRCSRADAGRSARALRPLAGELSPTVAATHEPAAARCSRGRSR